jgi:hypothetical protein
MYLSILDSPDTLSKEDYDYLGKIRAMYTPQHLQALEGFFKDVADQGFDELIILARKSNATQEKFPNQKECGPQEYQESPALQSGA